MFQQYKGMKREVYILFYGRIVTSMGAVIWPMMTLILSNKMGMSASQIATYLLVMGLCQLPFTLLGGKVADRFNKKYNIIFCDLVTVICYLICAMIPLSNTSIVLFFIAGVFAALEHPSYNALIADLTDSEEREKAFSLSYLGMNLGLVLAPTLGGFLFEHYLHVAFVITSLATFSSTVLIFFFVKQLKKEGQDECASNVYEQQEEARSLIKVLLHSPCILCYIALMGISFLVYSQFNFLMPLNMEMSFGVAGAKYFGMITSVNAAVVILGTPILTRYCTHIKETRKMRLGVLLEVIGLSMFIFMQGRLWLHFVAMIIFTLGEVLNTLGTAPYISRRVPSSHRGRINSIELIFTNGFQTIGQLGVGQLMEHMPIVKVWSVISLIGFGVVAGLVGLEKLDAKTYPLLQQKP